VGFKEKLIGIILIILGALPWLLKIQVINDTIGKYAANPGTSLYQIILIVLGLLLLVTLRPRAPVQLAPTK
jgi:hypothetical protein